MNRYNSKENSRQELIPSISNKKINLNILSENSAPSKKLIIDRNKSKSTQNLTLKALNDLSLYVVNIPSVKDIKKSIDDYYTKNELKNGKTPYPFIYPINFSTIKIEFPNEAILNGYKTYILFLKYEDQKFKHILVKKENLLKTIKKIKLKNLNLQHIKRNFIIDYSNNEKFISKENDNNNDDLDMNYFYKRDYQLSIKEINELKHNLLLGMKTKRFDNIQENNFTINHNQNVQNLVLYNNGKILIQQEEKNDYNVILFI
jgi:hypothetical protein